jgi:hypothetical protein
MPPQKGKGKRSPPGSWSSGFIGGHKERGAEIVNLIGRQDNLPHSVPLCTSRVGQSNLVRKLPTTLHDDPRQADTNE